MVGENIDAQKSQRQALEKSQKMLFSIHPKMNYTSKCYLKIASNDMEIT